MALRFAQMEATPSRHLALQTLLVFLAIGNLAEAATTATSPLFPEPAVYEFQIERTSAPLSMVTTIPPPLSLDEVRKLKSGEAPTTPVLSAPKLPGGAPLPAAPVRTRSSRVPTKASVLSSLPAPRATPGLRPIRRTPLPTVAVRMYTDRLILKTGKIIRCRIVGEKDDSLNVELESGVILDLPRRRIARVERGAGGQ